MKKNNIVLILIFAIIGIFTFSQCKKDLTCKMKVNCYYSQNGMDADTVCPNAKITFNIEKYQAGPVLDTIAKVVAVEADNHGVFEYTLDYPALLIVEAVKIDTIFDETGAVANILKYTGTTQVQVSEGELTEKDILLIQTN